MLGVGTLLPPPVNMACPPFSPREGPGDGLEAAGQEMPEGGTVYSVGARAMEWQEQEVPRKGHEEGKVDAVVVDGMGNAGPQVPLDRLTTNIQMSA